MGPGRAIRIELNTAECELFNSIQTSNISIQSTIHEYHTIQASPSLVEALRGAATVRTLVLKNMKSSTETLCALASGLRENHVCIREIRLQGIWHVDSVEGLTNLIAAAGPTLPVRELAEDISNRITGSMTLIASASWVCLVVARMIASALTLSTF